MPKFIPAPPGHTLFGRPNNNPIIVNDPGPKPRERSIIREKLLIAIQDILELDHPLPEGAEPEQMILPGCFFFPATKSMRPHIIDRENKVLYYLKNGRLHTNSLD